MNDQTEIDTGTALALPAQADLATLFRAEDGLDPIITQLEARVKEDAARLSVETAKGRKALKSLAFKVSESKAELERQAKSLTEAQRKEIDAVNASRNAAVARLEKLRDDTKAPVLAWESAEQARIAGHKEALSRFDQGRADAQCTVEQINHVISDIEAIEVGPDWDEYEPIAEKAKESCLAKLRTDLTIATERAKEQAELAELRAQAEMRARQDAERAEKEAAEKAERDRIEAERVAAEQAEARRIEAEKAEAERVAQIERDKKEAAERAAEQAKADAEREAMEREEQHQREIAAAKAREEAAAQAERDRLAAERRAEIEAEEKRRADADHANRIKTAIRDALVTFTAPYGDEDMSLAADIAGALFNGEIPHVEVKA